MNIYGPTIYRDQLNIYLPRTLSRQCNGRYGLHNPAQTRNRLAYPCERGITKLSSQFATIDELLNFTIQGNLKTSFTQQEISLFISNLKFKFATTSKYDYDYQCYLSITNSIPNWPKSILCCTQNHIIALQKAINNSYNLKLYFIVGHILPKILLHPQKVTSTAHNLVYGMEKIYGASGTINSDTLSPKLKTIETKDTPVDVLLALWEKSQQAIYTLENKKAEEMLKTAITNNKDCRVIIDVNNTFRDLTDEREIARIVFENTSTFNPSVDAFSYYDKDGNNMVLMRPQAPNDPIGDPIARDKCEVNLENIYIFMRQSATVGADTPMPMAAKALVTVGSDTQRDLFLQGVGRMRGLQSGQEVGFLIENKDVPVFKKHQDNQQEKITLQAILRLVGNNQAEQRGQDVFFNLKLLLQNFVEQQFWEFVDQNHKNIDACVDRFNKMNKFFVESSLYNPLESLQQSRQNVPIKDAVNQLKDTFIRKVTADPELKDIVNLDLLNQEFANWLKFDKLPHTVNVGSVGGEGVSEVEVDMDANPSTAESERYCDQEQELEQEREQEREQVHISALPVIPYRAVPPIESQNYHEFVINPDSSPKKHFSGKFSPLLQQFHGSTNFFRMKSDGTRVPGMLKASYQYLLICEQDQFTVVLMDMKDAKHTRNQMNDEHDIKSHTKDYYLMSSNGEVIAQNAGKPLNKERWKNNPQLTILTKIFTRTLNFSREETEYLATLDHQTRELYFAFFKQEISSCWPDIAYILEAWQDRVKKDIPSSSQPFFLSRSLYVRDRATCASSRKNAF